MKSLYYSLYWHFRWPFRTFFDKRREAKDLAKLKRLVDEDVLQALRVLTPREFHVVGCRIEGQSFEQIAEEMNVTRERVRQIQAKAMRKLTRGR